MFYAIIIIFVLTLLLAIFLLVKFTKKNNKLNGQKKIFFNKALKRVKVSISNKEKIIELDKIYHKILIEYWYKWTFWEILKSKPNIIRDIDKIWELHKLRNKLVHDFDLLNDIVLRKKSIEYEQEINALLR